MASADITKNMVMTWKMTWGMTCQADTAAADPPLFQEHQAVPVLAVATADLPRPAHQADPALAVAMADLPRPDLRADPALVVTVAGLPHPAHLDDPELVEPNQERSVASSASTVDQLMDACSSNRRVKNPPNPILDTALHGSKRVYSGTPTVGLTCRIDGVLQVSPESHNDLSLVTEIQSFERETASPRGHHWRWTLWTFHCC